jgi:hypothetical protein
MTLKEIITRAEELYRKLENENFRIIREASGRLVELLEKNNPQLKKFPEETRFEFFDIENKSYSFRYCGRFYNALTLEANNVYDTTSIMLSMTADETLADSRQNREDPLQEHDLKNFRMLVRGLEPFFRNTDIREEYTAFRKEVCAQKESDLIERNLVELLNDDLQTTMEDLFKQLFQGEDIRLKKALLMLPEGFNLHLRGKYYNALICEPSGVSLAYVKNINNIYGFCAEDDYCHDEYTRYREDFLSDVNFSIVHKETLWTLGYPDQGIIDILKIIESITADPELVKETKNYII